MLQKKALEMFNFSLNPGGVLFLGSSETIGEMSDCFDVIHQRHKLYRSIGKYKDKVLPSDKELKENKSFKTNYLFTVGEPRRLNRRLEDNSMMDRYMSVLQGQYIPFSVIVNEEMTVLHIFGETHGFFKVPSGKMVYDITKMAEKDLAIPLATGIQKALRTKTELTYTNVRFNHREDRKNITLRMLPLPDKKGFESLVAVFFEEGKTEARKKFLNTDVYDIEQDVQQRINDLEQELQFARENLQATIEELETSNEELQATNEELLASNEELQSTNEELQSTNEELFTVNSEYQNKITELTEMNNDVENLLSSSGVGILILDENNEIRKYSPKIPAIFNILEKDIGRPIHHISHNIEGFDPLSAARKVQQTNRQISMESTDQNNIVYLIRVLPYHIGPDSYAGTIFTFVDVTELKKVKQDLSDSLRLSEDITEYLPSGLFIYSLNEQNELVLENSNQKAEELTGISHKRLKGMPFQKIWPNAQRVGILNKFMDVMETGDPFVIGDLDYGDDNVSGHFRVTAFQLPKGKLAVIFEDITVHEKMRQQLGETKVKYNTLFERVSQGVVYQNIHGKIISANPAAERILGVSLDQMKGKTSIDPDWKVITPDGKDLPGTEHPSMIALKTGKSVNNFIMGVFHPGDKQHCWMRVSAFPEFRKNEKKPYQVFTMFEEITDQNEIKKLLAVTNSYAGD